MKTATIQPKDIVLETSLLKVMSIKENFDSYFNYIDHKRTLPTTNLILKDYKKYFDLFPEHKKVDFGKFKTQFTQNWHNGSLDEMDIEYYINYVFPLIQTSHAEEDEYCLLGLINRQTTELFSEVTSKDFNIEKLRNILDNHEKKQLSINGECDKDIYTINNIDFEGLDKINGIPYFLPSLQENLGSIVKGQFIVVSADVNTGKSAFVISQAVETFRHLVQTKNSQPILYFNSEGTEADVMCRFLSNLYSGSIKGGFEEIVNNREEVKKGFLENYPAELFMVTQLNDVSIIKTKIQKYNPSLVIIDITDALAPEEDVKSLKKVYDILRSLSTFCPIIGTTQAGDQSYFDKESGAIKHRRRLGLNALYGSKPGKGGAADTIITIGIEDNNPSIRHISVPKKKRGKAVDITCKIEEIYSLYKELTF